VSSRYHAPANEAAGELREQGSVFLAALRPIASEEEAKAALAEIAALHTDATHHCWAFRLGPEPARERSADAGEPHGTAGEPILRSLRGAGLSDALVVVTRWFGGTKLGKGGLARAYAAAAQAAIAAAPTVERAPTREIEVLAPYDAVGAIKRLLRPPAVELVEESYGERAALRLRVWAEREAQLRAALAELSNRIEVVDARRSRR
jgi:uncharacterized YigZ family protein